MSDPNDDDMDKPLTKREALEVFLTKREALELFLTKREAHEVFLTRGEFHDAMKKLFAHLDKMRGENAAEHAATRAFVSNEIARHTDASAKSSRGELVAIDDKYKALPERVTKLEGAVFPSPPAKRQRRR
jgi:hypothetical protein